MRNYLIDFGRLSRSLLPHFLQSGGLQGWVTSFGFVWVNSLGQPWATGSASRHLAWLRALVAPIQSLNYTFLGLVTQTRYRLYLTGQVIYLEHYLNDVFDPTLRRIYIEDGNRAPLFLYNKADDLFFYIYNKSEAQPGIYVDGSLGGDVYDFVVHVPFNLGTSDPVLVPKVRTRVNQYKEAGKVYRVEGDPTGPSYFES